MKTHRDPAEPIEGEATVGEYLRSQIMPWIKQQAWMGQHLPHPVIVKLNIEGVEHLIAYYWLLG